MHRDDSRKHVKADYIFPIHILQLFIECFAMHQNGYSICLSILQTL